ncbi:hypothetical protein [Kribbella sp. NPDC049227]|jgi:hypothetical protein|uniref:hypothetical protein n=1 Tax=Kribbella sp. NPDC049227 TaxID=3364113 RepID=UPI003717B25D
MTDSDSGARWKYGLIALGIGAATLIAAVVIIGIAWNDNATALAAVTGTIGTIVGAYFGLQVGGAEAEDAKKKRDEAEGKKDSALKANVLLASQLPPDQAGPIQAHFGLQ